ncbi:MAG TPA: VWA domain-containing protein [Candidatus Acidoferrales bacterium]|jgi:VWFA-related protein|nr:VWA domain-containing protein [Candidatus Acidoferrales bacterium]
MNGRNKLVRFATLGAGVIAIASACVWAGGARAQQLGQQPPEPATKKKADVVSTVDMVVLHAVVSDKRGVFVNNLPPESFRAFEDKVEQKLMVAKQEDMPVSVGLVIDNSGSMHDKRAKVNAAALTFVESSNPSDEAFVVNFNDDFYIDTQGDFTSDIKDMKDALEKIEARGSTALYDAIIGSLDHLKKARKDKRVLLVVTDGQDTASRSTLANVIREIQHSDVLVYAVGVFAKDETRSTVRKARKALEDIAESSGGLAYFPEEVSDTTDICKQIAHDIRNQYTLAYYPSNVKLDGTFRTVSVEATAPKVGKLLVRTRPGYYAKLTGTKTVSQ